MVAPPERHPDRWEGRNVEPRVSLITPAVGDLERSIRFHRSGLGLPRRECPEGTLG
jgi:hypothetical protein